MVRRANLSCCANSDSLLAGSNLWPCLTGQQFQQWSWLLALDCKEIQLASAQSPALAAAGELQ